MARLILAIAVLAGVMAVAARPGWARFYSARYRFACFYPGSWRPVEPDLAFLDVVNFPAGQGGGGTLLTQDGAELMVYQSNRPGASVNDLVVDSQKHVHDAPSVDETILTGLTGANDCRTLRRVEYHLNLGSALDPILEHLTDYYCEARHRIVVVRLGYYRGNKKSAFLESVAREAADTLQVYPLAGSNKGPTARTPGSR